MTVRVFGCLFAFRRASSLCLARNAATFFLVRSLRASAFSSLVPGSRGRPLAISAVSGCADGLRVPTAAQPFGRRERNSRSERLCRLQTMRPDYAILGLGYARK